MRGQPVEPRPLTSDDHELIEHARAIVDANTDGPHGIHTVGNEGRGPIPPCGRDRQVRVDHHPDIRVILPTSRGLGSVNVRELLPQAVVGGPEQGE